MIRDEILKHITRKPTFPFNVCVKYNIARLNGGRKRLAYSTIEREIRHLHVLGKTEKLPKQEGRNQHPIRLKR